MRRHMSEFELKAIAEEMSYRNIVERSEDLSINDVERKPTKKEREMLFDLFYGTLLGLNWGESTRADRECQTTIDTIEFICIRMLPHLNSYLSVYCPLKKFLREWEEA